MQRAWLLSVVLVAACSPDSRHVPDAKPIDAPPDSSPDAAGSGSNVAFAMEPIPHDNGLELVVGVASMVVVVVPVGARRRRREDDDTPTT